MFEWAKEKIGPQDKFSKPSQSHPSGSIWREYGLCFGPTGLTACVIIVLLQTSSH